MSKMITRTGRVVDLIQPDPSTIHICDIGWALSRIGRFNGHTVTVFPYSVAQHSVRVSKMVPIEYSVYGLLHDAHEAYLGDIPRPVALIAPGMIQSIKWVMQLAIFAALNLDPPDADCVSAIHDADDQALADELHWLMPKPLADIDLLTTAKPKATASELTPVSSITAFHTFMSHARRWLPDHLFADE